MEKAFGSFSSNSFVFIAFCNRCLKVSTGSKLSTSGFGEGGDEIDVGTGDEEIGVDCFVFMFSFGFLLRCGKGEALLLDGEEYYLE